MAAKKAKRMVWRISDIVGAVRPGVVGLVRAECARLGGDVPSIMAALWVTLPATVGMGEHEWRMATTCERAAALVATAKRLRVPQVPA